MNLPQEFTLGTNKPYNQKNVGACVACSIASMLEYIKNDRYSILGLYGYRPEYYNHSEGSDIISLLKTAKEQGVLLENETAEICEMPEAENLIMNNIEELLPIANQRKLINGYGRLHGEDEIKQSVYDNKIPVIVSIGINQQRLELKNNIAQQPNKVDNWHTVIIYGWNKDGYLAQNTWGEDWGNKGNFILPYSYPITESGYIKK